MATGLDGANGRDVASHVEVDLRQGTGHVQTQNPYLEATIAPEMIPLYLIVQTTLVQVCVL